MKALDVVPFRRKLADLAGNAETSGALRAYLDAALQRDVVDVLNEIDVLTQLFISHAKREGES